MQIEKTQKDDFIQFSLSGDLDASSSILMDEALNEAYNNRQYNIKVDCKALNYISSAGVGVFISHLENFEQKNGTIVLYNTRSTVYDVFEMLGLLNLMNIYRSENTNTPIVEK